jgi:hypothetical protein
MNEGWIPVLMKTHESMLKDAEFQYETKFLKNSIPTLSSDVRTKYCFRIKFGLDAAKHFN